MYESQIYNFIIYLLSIILNNVSLIYFYVFQICLRDILKKQIALNKIIEMDDARSDPCMYQRFVNFRVLQAAFLSVSTRPCSCIDETAGPEICSVIECADRVSEKGVNSFPRPGLATSTEGGRVV